MRKSSIFIKNTCTAGRLYAPFRTFTFLWHVYTIYKVCPLRGGKHHHRHVPTLEAAASMCDWTHMDRRAWTTQVGAACVSVTPWSVRVRCWEPPLNSLPKEKLHCCCATGMLDLLVTVRRHGQIKLGAPKWKRNLRLHRKSVAFCPAVHSLLMTEDDWMNIEM